MLKATTKYLDKKDLMKSCSGFWQFIAHRNKNFLVSNPPAIKEL